MSKEHEGQEEEIEQEEELGGTEEETGGEEETFEETEKTPDEKKFSQADLDSIIAERLARHKSKADAEKEVAEVEAERIRLEEAEEYKALAETYKAELEAQKADVLDTQKSLLLTKAGYTDDQTDRYIRYIDGADSEEIAASVAKLIEDIPPKPPYADPGTGNGKKDKVGTKDAGEIGRLAFERLKAIGKIR